MRHLFSSPDFLDQAPKGALSTPRRSLLLMGLVVGGFLALGLVFKFLWVTERTDIPFIEASPGPLRVRPSQAPPLAQHRVYAGLSGHRYKPEADTESVLPLPETPIIHTPLGEAPEEPVLAETSAPHAGGTKEGTPSAPKSSTPPTVSHPKQPLKKREERGALDALLRAVESAPVPAAASNAYRPSAPGA
jgi:hypothetical protein